MAGVRVWQALFCITAGIPRAGAAPLESWLGDVLAARADAFSLQETALKERAILSRDTQTQGTGSWKAEASYEAASRGQPDAWVGVTAWQWQHPHGLTHELEASLRDPLPKTTSSPRSEPLPSRMEAAARLEWDVVGLVSGTRAEHETRRRLHERKRDEALIRQEALERKLRIARNALGFAVAVCKSSILSEASRHAENLAAQARTKNQAKLISYTAFLETLELASRMAQKRASAEAKAISAEEVLAAQGERFARLARAFREQPECGPALPSEPEPSPSLSQADALGEAANQNSLAVAANWDSRNATSRPALAPYFEGRLERPLASGTETSTWKAGIRLTVPLGTAETSLEEVHDRALSLRQKESTEHARRLYRENLQRRWRAEREAAQALQRHVQQATRLAEAVEERWRTGLSDAGALARALIDRLESQEGALEAWADWKLVAVESADLSATLTKE